MTRRILGIDPGSNVTGWGVVDVTGSRLAHVAHGEVRTSARSPIEERLVEIHDAVAAVIEKFHPVSASVEMPFVSENAQTAIILGHARGAAILAIAKADIAVTPYPPATVKQAIVGNGRADKSQVQLMVKTLLNLREKPSPDAADALAMALCHAFRWRP